MGTSTGCARAAAAALLSLSLAAAAAAQGRLPTVRPPDPIDRAEGLSTRPRPAVPSPAPVEERWVPERRFYSPRLGREVVVPGHYERRITDQQYQVPPLTGTTRPEGRQVPIPGGEHPPAEIRSAP